MSKHRVAGVSLAIVLMASSLFAGDLVPFRGSWEGSTVSAIPISPTVVFVVSSGSGEATHLGRFEMTTPHYTYLDTFTVEGEQHFTAANGDTLEASYAGQVQPNAEGCVVGTLPASITGGTGRFAGATGSYFFHLVACPGAFGFDSTAAIDGWISTGRRD